MVVCPSFTVSFVRTSYGNEWTATFYREGRTYYYLRVLCKPYNVIKNSICEMLGPTVLTFKAGETEIVRKSSAKVSRAVNYS
jgi:hypothetical protein